jgi:hypothetical protein
MAALVVPCKYDAEHGSVWPSRFLDGFILHWTQGGNVIVADAFTGELHGPLRLKQVRMSVGAQVEDHH